MIDNISIQKKILNDIKNHEWHVLSFSIDGNMPAFGYTIGLFQNFNHAEVMVFGLSPDIIQQVLNQVGIFVSGGGKIIPDVEYCDTFILDYPVIFLEVQQAYYKRYLQYAEWYYQDKEYSVLQMVWPDKSGCFPWESKFDSKIKFNQPLLDRNMDFFFYEDRQLGVYTTRQVIEKNYPILAVYHDSDGDWQFLCDTTTDIADLRVVSLEYIARKDDSLNDLFDLPIGWRAQRTNADSEWVREQWEN